MPVLNVRRYGDPILRQKAQPVEAVTPEIRKTLADMLETMYHQVGIGLAAPQVGIGPRIILVDDGPRDGEGLIGRPRHPVRGLRQQWGVPERQCAEHHLGSSAEADHHS